MPREADGKTNATVKVPKSIAEKYKRGRHNRWLLEKIAEGDNPMPVGLTAQERGEEAAVVSVTMTLPTKARLNEIVQSMGLTKSEVMRRWIVRRVRTYKKGEHAAETPQGLDPSALSEFDKARMEADLEDMEANVAKQEILCHNFAAGNVAVRHVAEAETDIQGLRDIVGEYLRELDWLTDGNRAFALDALVEVPIGSLTYIAEQELASA